MLIDESEIVAPLKIEVNKAYLLQSHLTYLEAIDLFYDLTEVRLSAENFIELIWKEKINLYLGSKTFKELESAKPLHHQISARWSPPHIHKELSRCAWPSNSDPLFRAIEALVLYVREESGSKKFNCYSDISFSKSEIITLAGQLNDTVKQPHDQPEQKTSKKRAEYKNQTQDRLILTQIEKLGYPPTKLPAMKAGKAGVKSQVRDALDRKGVFEAPTAFDSAWKRLRKYGLDGGIAELK